jgi:hypothetical protein
MPTQPPSAIAFVELGREPVISLARSPVGVVEAAAHLLHPDGDQVQIAFVGHRAATRAISINHSGRASAGTVTSVLAARCPPSARSRAAMTGASGWPTTT